MKTALITALFLTAGSLAAQEPPKETKVRVRKVEVVNGVQTIRDTTFTTTDPLASGHDPNTAEIRELREEKLGAEDIMLLRRAMHLRDSLGLHRETVDQSRSTKAFTIDRRDSSNRIVINRTKGQLSPEEEKLLTEEGMLMIKKAPCGSSAADIEKAPVYCIVKVERRIFFRDLSAEERSRLGLPASENSKLETTDISFYPNPSDGKGNLSFRLPSASPAKVVIADLTGKVVYEDSVMPHSGLCKKEIDLSTQARGAYIVTITQDGRQDHRKILLE